MPSWPITTMKRSTTKCLEPCASLWMQHWLFVQRVQHSRVGEANRHNKCLGGGTDGARAALRVHLPPQSGNLPMSRSFQDVAVLNTLIATLLDSIDGYQKSAGDI